MANEFIIKNGFHSKGDSQVTGSLNITDSLTVNGSAVGAAFPFTGDAQITGSLIVSGSTPLTLQGGTTNSDTVLLAENSSGLDLLTVKGDGELIINNATNGLTGKLSFGNGISDGFIYMQDLATGPSSKYSIPQRTSNDDSSLQFLVGNTAAGPKLFPHKDTSQGLADRSVIEIDLYNSGNNSRGLDFIVGGAAVTTTYQPKLWRFFSWDGVNDPDSGNVERLSIGNSPLTTGGDAIIAISSSRVGIGAPSPSASLEINPPSGSFPSLIVSGSSEFIGNISGSATSTASFGTYLGDGSQLTGVSVFPFTGDAQITGSLEITGSLKMIRPSNKLDLSIGSNIIIGREAGNSISDDRGAIFLGYKAGYTNTSPSSNIAIGYGAGGALGTNASQQNIFMGYLAGAGNTSIGSITSRMSAASNNIGMGYQALLYLTSGDQNIALGAAVMRNVSTGGNNTALGAYALYNTDSGDNNIGIGYYAGLNQTSGDGNITIGSGSLGIAGESNQLRIGNGNSLVTISASLETGDVIFASTASAAYFVGDGSQLTGVSVFPFTGDAQITGSLTITGSAALAVTSSENISVAKYENGAHQSYCIPEVHYHSWYYNTTTRPIFEDDYINFGWAGTDLELTVKQLGTDDNVHITKNISNAYSFISVTNTSQFDLDGSMSAEESSFFYITNIHDDSYPMYKVIVTRAATDGTNKNMYMLVEKIKKTL